MTNLGGYSVCGRTGQIPFANFTLPAKDTNGKFVCPAKTKPCSPSGETHFSASTGLFCFNETLALQDVCPLTYVNFARPGEQTPEQVKGRKTIQNSEIEIVFGKDPGRLAINGIFFSPQPAEKKYPTMFVQEVKWFKGASSNEAGISWASSNTLLNQYKAGTWNITFYDLMAANGDLLSIANQRLELTHEFESGEFKNQNFTYQPWVVQNTGWNLTCHEMGRSPLGYFDSTYEGAFSDIENAAVCS